MQYVFKIFYSPPITTFYCTNPPLLFQILGNLLRTAIDIDGASTL